MGRLASLLTRCLPLVLVVLAAPGCLTLETTVRVRPDGSGLVEQLFVLTGPALRMAASLASGEEPLELFSDDDLHALAEAMGEGVRLFSVERIADAGALGYRAFFAFDDVGTLRVYPDPSPRRPLAAQAPVDPVTFRLDRGPTSTLHIRVPELRLDAMADPAVAFPPFHPDTLGSDAALDQIRSLLQGGRIRLAVDVEGTIGVTDASHHDDHRVVLLEADFDRILLDDERLRGLVSAAPASPDEARALIAGLDGVRLETRRDIAVRFE